MRFDGNVLVGQVQHFVPLAHFSDVPAFYQFMAIRPIKGITVHHTIIIVIERLVTGQGRHLVNRRVGILGIYLHNHTEILPVRPQLPVHVSFYL